MRTSRALPCLILAALAAPAAAGPGAWTSSGPDGGTMYYLVADGAVPGRLVAATRGGLFRSDDGGVQWQRFEAGVDFHYPYTLQAATGGSTLFVAPNARTLFRSEAGGDWLPTALALDADAFLYDVSLRDGSDQFVAVSSSQGLYRSTDGGASFAPMAGAGLPGNAVARIEDAGSLRLYAAYGQPMAPSDAQVFRSDDNGATWTPTAPLPGFNTWVPFHDGDLEAAPGNRNRVYLATQSAMFRTADGGSTWAECGDPGASLGQVHVSATNPDHVWVASSAGLQASTDGCATWTALGNGVSADGARPDVVEGMAFAPTFPGDDRVWVASEHGGVYRSEDAGASFVAASAGLVSSNIRAIAPHPVDPSRLLAGFGDAFSPSGTMFRSSDAGASWQRSNSGLNAVQIRGITFDPTTAALPGGGHVYAVGSARQQHLAPAPGTDDGGIYKSLDGGTTWTTIDNGLPATYFGTRFIGTVRNLVLDPRSCASPPASGACSTGPLQTAYVTSSGRPDYNTGTYAAARIYKSTNAGAGWTAAENGLPMPTRVGDCHTAQIAVPMVADPDASGTLYVGLSFSGYGEGCAAPTMPNGVFKSIDGGATWTHSSNGIARIAGPGTSHYNVLALAMDPNDPLTLYAGAYPDFDDIEGRVFKSTDGGANWTDVSVGIAGADVRALLVDPSDSSTVYAGIGGGTPADPSGIYRSTDGGLTWNSFSIGLPADAATALAIDPHVPGRLFAGTVGGVWEFTPVPDPDSDGAPTATESASPNGGDANADGIADAQQSDVASFQGTGAFGGALRGSLPQITLDVEPVAGHGCARINNAHALPGDQLPADVARGVAPARFDGGVLRFELPDCNRARVTVQFHGAEHADVDWTWRNYGPLRPGDAGSFAWYTFAGARKTGPGRWELTIDADERGNYRSSGDAILFVGAPGFVDIHLFGDGME